MKLRTKIPLILGLAIFLMSAVFYVFTSQKLLEESASIERIDIERDIQRVSSSLQREVDGIMANTADYATWDATYAYAEDLDPTYLNENYEGTSFVNLKLNVAIIYNDKNELLYKRGFDFENDEPAELPENFFDVLAQYPDLLKFEDITKGKTEMFDINGKTMILTSRPILTSNQEGPSRGALMMGRWLDATAVEHLSALTQLNISLVDNPEAASIERLAHTDLKLDIPEKVSAELVSDNEITASILLTDAKNTPIAILQISKQRPGFLLTVANIRELFGMTLVMCLFTIFISLYLLD